MLQLNRESPSRILVVDDEPEIVAFIRELLINRGYQVLGLSDSREVSARFDSFRPDACVFDFRMPHHSGADLLDFIKKKDSRIEVIFLTAQDEASLAVDVMKRGATDFLLKPVEVNQLLLSIGRALEHRRLVIENQDYRLHLEQLVLEKTKALNEALTSLNYVHSATLDALSMALDFRDQSTSGHSRRVADLTAGAAASMGIRDSALVQIEHGALLHDIGKLKIPDSILWKPARLDDSEWTTMRRHAEYGYQFLSNVEFLKGAAEIVYSHHEKYDGTGYPRGLRGEQIPFGARVFMVVDTVDAMIYKRPYNQPVSFREAAAEVRRCTGTQFDPGVVEPTLEYLKEHIPAELR
ncbi:MAG TPA: HD domain-containing phosphohydrolase [Terriglobia bacterium]|nr:HD domain-containing phosphohydrolase [Terriglobia bacterium]